VKVAANGVKMARMIHPIKLLATIHLNTRGSCPESLVARGQARLFGVAGSNPPGSVSTALSDSNVSVSLIHACGIITPA